jgi:imidazolonepropionase-like amidohydrolase
MVDGFIRAVGADVTIPDDAELFDASGMWVTPGLVSAWTDIGLVEIGYESAEDSYDEDDVSAGFDVRPSINPQSVLIPETMLGGVTTVFSSPSAGIVSGQGAVIDLFGETVDELLIDSSTIVVAHLNQSAVSAGHGSRAGAYGRLERLLNDAQLLNDRRTDFEQRAMQDLSASSKDVEAMIPVVLGERPIMITANRQSDIRNALRLGEQFDLDLILNGVSEGWLMADDIAAAGVPVVMNAIENIPSYDGLSVRFENAALMSEAGVKIALANGLASGTRYNVRNLRVAAGNAVSYGLAWDVALRAITIDAADILKISGSHGSLEPGKVANIVVWSGDPFELDTVAEAVYVRGERVSETSRQVLLRDRYLERLGLKAKQ